MRKFLLLLVGIFCLNMGLFTQNITGIVWDDTLNEPLAFANVVLMQLPDSTFIEGTVTDLDGHFSIPVKDKNDLLLSISFIGFKVHYEKIKPNAASVGKITMSADSEILSEVVVRTNRQLFKMEAGGISTDIANSGLKNLGNALDVLEKLPFVFRNGDAVTVIGKGSPLVFINNRQVRDNSEIERLNSSDIKKITVVTNPGPEYDATVSSVIRIETIRPVGEGLSGTVSGGLMQKRKLFHTERTDLNYRMGNLDLFGGAGYVSSKSKQYKDLSQELLSTALEQKYIQNYNTHFYYIYGGFNYIIDVDHTVGARYSFDDKPTNGFRIQTESEVRKNGVLTETFSSDLETDNSDRRHLLNAYYEGKMTEWLRLKIDFDYLKGENLADQYVFNQGELRDEYVHTQTDQFFDLVATKFTLTTPVWDSEIKYGGEYVYTKTDQVFFVEDTDAAENLRSDNNSARQKLFAAYVHFNKSIGKFNFSAGLRFENVAFEYLSGGVSMDDQNRTYRDLFPTGNISYQLGKTQMMVGYRSTTGRPSYFQLRNTLQYNGPYTYEAGNPYLKSFRTNDLSYTFLWKDIQAMVSYKFYKDYIIYVPQQFENTDILVYRPENIDKSQHLTIAAYYSPRLGIWHPVIGGALEKDYLKWGANEQKYNDPVFFGNMQNNFELPYNIRIGLDTGIRSKGNSTLAYNTNSFVMNFNFTKTFRNDQWTINLIATDILNTERSKMDLSVDPIRLYQVNNPDNRGIRLNVRYRFNSTRSKYHGESAGGNELNRF